MYVIKSNIVDNKCIRIYSFVALPLFIPDVSYAFLCSYKQMVRDQFPNEPKKTWSIYLKDVNTLNTY